MPVLPGSHYLNTLGDVNTRVRSILNDDNAQLWPDGATSLLNAVRGAYHWLYNQVVRIQGQTFNVTLSDIPYTAATPAGQEQDLASILPVDVYFPRELGFRLSTSEEYLTVSRRQSLPSRTQAPPLRVEEWEHRGNTIIVTASQNSGLLKLTYTPLLGVVSLVTDNILIDNSVEAIAHRAAYYLARRRGQLQSIGLAARADAQELADAILDHLVLSEQEVPRRGTRFSETDTFAISYRDFIG